ncbi:hypothetical protein ACFFJY_09335 [Fictibacillus aquaticus]|uniref:Minor capsid protein n=1 Tax=Fictibacillus aquaticus TaxID=2021314 RepID=A0A235FAW4_9BACL|nr:hypothetical protein [Fictibacillus aquaticus]OYD58476.1 hypothetical protein CGZ90_00825 [Fictibacillus aquaticus]
MIQRYLKDLLKEKIPSLEWSIDYSTSDDHTGAVYYEGGLPPDQYESKTRYPQYMVYIQSSDWRMAGEHAEKAYQTLNGLVNFIVTEDIYDGENVVGQRTYHVLFIRAMAEPNRIGVDDGVMEYSINFQAILREV